MTQAVAQGIDLAAFRRAHKNPADLQVPPPPGEQARAQR
jgi:hypothetical protein